MKKIINGKSYNTETAEFVITLFNSVRQFQRDYYRSKKGQFFVHYVEVNDIDLVTDESMMAILAANDPDKYVKYFGEVEEG